MKGRKVYRGAAIVACLVAPLAWAGTETATETGTGGGAPERVAEGRAIAQQFGAELRAALQEAMAAGGPLAAIAVCEQDAPRIAREASERSGAAVGRTSTRTRNTDNHPDGHQHAVLNDFAAAMADGAQGASLERLEQLEDGRERYMRAIVIEPPCLVCHGAELAPEVAATLDAAYPQDTARGYQLGELRGAFTVTWPKD